MDSHLNLETTIENFLKAEKCVIYSSAYATVMSILATFSGPGDYLFVDEYCYHPIQTGGKLSKANIIYFKHNDMKDYEDKLQDQIKELRKKGKSHSSVRSIAVVEGIYHNTGEVCPLDQLVAISKKYKINVCIDDSIGIGTVGKGGRGSCEVFNIDLKDVAFVCGTLSWAIGSDGGFCCSTKGLSAYQRLRSTGYVFSASSPPFLVEAARRGFEIIKESNGSLQSKLEENCGAIYDGLTGLKNLRIRGTKKTPIIHLELIQKLKDREHEERKLQEIVDFGMEHKVLLTRALYVNSEDNLPRASIRITTSAVHDRADIQTLLSALQLADQTLF
eukprot:TRINITY_DN2146_c0_g1_i3.p1 TRINITY_DN2146_c0_g1~~TRINITY_DN2146_c0_g1_i3.p1  ORF type:complete len:332 (+),score=73.41 TRINITY_DN2146_c0_g1_i3:116-1111(+)